MPPTSLYLSVFASIAASWLPAAAAGSTEFDGILSSVQLEISASASSLVAMITNRARHLNECVSAPNVHFGPSDGRPRLSNTRIVIHFLMCGMLHSLKIFKCNSTMLWYCSNSTFHHERVLDVLTEQSKPLITSGCSTTLFNFLTEWASFCCSATFNCLAILQNQLTSEYFSISLW